MAPGLEHLQCAVGRGHGTLVRVCRAFRSSGYGRSAAALPPVLSAIPVSGETVLVRRRSAGSGGYGPGGAAASDLAVPTFSPADPGTAALDATSGRQHGRA